MVGRSPRAAPDRPPGRSSNARAGSVARRMGSGSIGRAGVKAAVVVVGLGLGLGGAVAVRNAGRPEAPRPTPSVQEFSFPAPPPAAEGPAPADPAPAALAEEPADGRAAVAAFLGALAERRPQQSYLLLDSASLRLYPSVAEWTAAQADRIAPASFELGDTSAATNPGGAPVSPGSVDVAVNATHLPSLDPFRGLVPGRSRSSWRAVAEDGRWRVGADPVSFVPELPPDSSAPPVVSAWLARLAECDAAGAAALQVEGQFYGPPTLVRAPCESGRAGWTVGSPSGLDRAPDARAFLAAFGPGVGTWARLVPVKGPASGFLAAVAPVGDTWRVLGVAVE